MEETPGSSVHGSLQARVPGRWPFPSPGDLPNPEIEPRSPALQADALPSEPPGKPQNSRRKIQKSHLRSQKKKLLPEEQCGHCVRHCWKVRKRAENS